MRRDALEGGCLEANRRAPGALSATRQGVKRVSNLASRRLNARHRAAAGTCRAIAARAGGASMVRGAARVALWGLLAMAATADAGELFRNDGRMKGLSRPPKCA